MLFKRKKPERVAKHGFIEGRVQSVAFRFYTRQEATQLQLSGWVQNLADGRVEFHVQGAVGSVKEFLDWARIGPPLAVVRDLTVHAAELEPHDLFEIR